MAPRTNRKRVRLEEESDEYDSSTESSAPMASQRVKTMDLDSQDWDAEEMDRNIKAVCRYAMSCEFRKKVIRREDMNKLLTEGCKKMLNKILDKAREKLRHVFGFEIIELPSMKEKTNQSQTQKIGSSQQQAQETQMTSTQTARRAVGPSSGTYILRSTLKEEYRTPEIIERSKREYQLTGILYVILGLIFINGRSITTADLHGHLNTMKITKSMQGVEDTKTREALLNEFIKDNYLKRSKLPGIDNDETQYAYTWGPRAVVEVGHAGISAFLLNFWGEDLDDETRTDIHNKMWKQAG